ncbi:unnamed protein product [Ostreobium quekettii]|uniref:AAA+ ATPase domain-containing protein n=1 Tax=Ostreobium quekettii TaxID=121088 RepID=A0A8S1JDJ7_9CHLO|nr:unnamed protein product [Ostreobium quekettii]
MDMLSDLSGGLSSGAAAQIGVMNKLSTGSVVVDILLCMVLPLVLRRASDWVQDLRSRLETWLRSRQEFYRDIEHVTGDGYYAWGDQATEDNRILQEALLLYLDRLRPGLSPFKHTDVRLMLDTGLRREDSDWDSDADSVADSDDYSYAEELKRGRICTLPPQNDWIEVEEGLMMKRIESDESEKGEKMLQTKIRNTISLKSDAKDGDKRIDAFIAKAYAFYTEKMEDRKSNDRHLYTPLFRIAAKGNSGGDSDRDSQAQAMLFKRYRLSENKTFASFFHPEKDPLLQLINKFMNKTGKFAIPGYPHKLGILLYGPPGTGKTSLIKAIAQHTKRSIVSVPLNRIHTNQELMDLVFDQAYKVEGEGRAVRLPFKKTIFVMEDVDAACNVVLRRSPESPPPMPKALPLDPAEAAGELAKGKEAESKATGTLTREQIAFLFDKEDDKLNLAGLLNVLDGVVDCPERIVVMTTNHPEKLDPALIRPGRINKQIHMGNMRAEEALQMAAHYYGPVSPQDEAALRAALPDGALSPARLEAMCAEGDTLPELVEAIEQALGVRSQEE